MGRARGQTSAALAARDFDAVLGARRGSAAAQARRDAAELEQLAAAHEAAHEAALADFVVQVERIVASAAFTAEHLRAAYRIGRPGADVAAEILSQLRATELGWRTEKLRELAAILEVGDPVGCEELTAPAQQALCVYFQVDALVNHLASRQQGEFMIRRLFGDRHSQDHYRRLAPFIKSLAPLMAEPQRPAGPRLRLAAISALAAAPEPMLAGPLRCWIDAFAYSVEHSTLTAPETKGLANLVSFYRPGSQGAVALAGLAQQLRAASAVSP